MGGVKRIGVWISGGALKALSSLLDATEREAALGDLEEAREGRWRTVAAVSGLAARRTAMRIRRGEALIPVRAIAADAETPVAESWPEWLVPLVVGLIASTMVVALLVPPRANTLSWSGVFSRSAFLLGVAAVAAIAAVALLHQAYRDYFRRPGAALLACAWSSAIWIPLLLLVWSQHAIWVVLAPAPIAALVASFAKRKQSVYAEEDPELPGGRRVLFESGAELGRFRLARFAIAIACLLELCAGATAIKDVPLTCSLVILTTACVAWAFTPGRPSMRSSSAAPVRARVAVLPCFLLTCLALTPFLRLGLGSSRLNSVVLASALHAIPHVRPAQEEVFSRVVLLAPALPKRKLLMDPPKSQFGGVAHLAHPLVIRFDGSYWYFQAPTPGAKYVVQVKHGDPTKGHIYSNDYMPLEMEAHQPLGVHMNAGCCQSMSVSLVNADTRLGQIGVEALLRNVTNHGTEAVSLGTVPIRSTEDKKISTARPAVNETLHFPIGGKAASFQFNEITLVLKLAPQRAMAGARVQIVSFTLQP